MPLEVWARPIEDARNQIEFVLMTFQDITQRKLTEAELMDYRHQLEQLVDQRTAELSSANKLLWVEIGERHRLEEMLRLRLEWLVLSNQIAQNVIEFKRPYPGIPPDCGDDCEIVWCERSFSC